ncbi:putative ribonuclease H-like domain-containing protein, partial [Tanacetum coccineum]
KQGVSESSTSSQQDQDCIVMPIWKDDSYFGDDAPRLVVDAKIQDEDRLQDETYKDSSLKENSTADQQVNTVSLEVNTGSRDVNTASPEVNTGSRDVSTAVPEVNIATLEDLSSVQTRRMTSSYSELGFLSAIYEGKTHKDLQAMQEELLQFKLKKVWILVDLPKGHRAIGTKWVYRNKKDERGIVIRNKARLIA